MGTCRQCGSWSVVGHNHRKVIGRDPICASYHDMGLDLSGIIGSSETMCDEGEIETWLIMSVVYCWAIKGRAIAESKDESSHSAV